MIFNAIRDATSEDLPAIAAIQGPSGWEPKSYLSYTCRVFVNEGKINGFLVSRETGPGEREILNLAVDLAQRRHGVGRKLMEEELQRPAKRWFLEVRESNQAAINLYWSVGFRPAGRRADYYSDPPESAIVMRFLS